MADPPASAAVAASPAEPRALVSSASPAPAAAAAAAAAVASAAADDAAAAPAPPSPAAPASPRLVCPPRASRANQAEATRRSIFALVDGALGPPRARPSSVNPAGTLATLESRSPVVDMSAAPVGSAHPLVSRGGNYSRKDKSLGVLCEKFIDNYGSAPGSEIPLDAVADGLGVERRRIYDIINVLESLGVVHRQAKNLYAWNSIHDLTERLDALKAAARRDPTLRSLPPGSRVTPLQPLFHNPNPANIAASTDGAPDSVLARTGPPGASGKTATTGNRKEKSLGILCQRFVQLFLIADDCIVGLDDAAARLSDGLTAVPEPQAEDPTSDTAAKLLKTKVRRLYDIANVLTSLNLIEKVAVKTRKPCFRWIGVESNTVLGNLRSTPVRKKSTSSSRSRTISGLPPLKRHLSAASGSTGRRSTAKRRKAGLTGDTPSSPYSTGDISLPANINPAPPAAIAEHIPPEYHALWQQWVAFAQNNGNINPSEAAAAIARAASAAQAAAANVSANEGVGATSPSRLDATNARMSSSVRASAPPGCAITPETPVATRAGPNNGCSPVDSNSSTPGMIANSSPTDSILSPATKRQSSMSTPVRLMAAQQLSALSRTCRDNGKTSRGASPPCTSASFDCDLDSTTVDPSLSVKPAGGVGPVSRDDFDGTVAESRMSKGMANSRTDESSTVAPAAMSPEPQNPYKWTTPEHISEYMSQARAAGPQYAEAAEKWLTQVRQWQSLWGPLAASLGGKMRDSETPKIRSSGTD